AYPTLGEPGCVGARLGMIFRTSGGNIRQLIVGLTQTDAFLKKPISPTP
ncbi:MAG: hypothetical protein RJA70_4218, partial [Pseudomonadota bacterium]